MKYTFALWLLGCLLFLGSNIHGQSYTSFFTGDTSDVVTNHQAGYLLAGGGPDSDAAMSWLIEKADGGDILILRASGSDGYNEYLYSELGITVNSVETILFESAQASTDPYVLRRIEEAEVIFIAGGDQSVYRDYWRDSPVADAINALIVDKGGAVGGTSAGMAILGGVYYAPENGSLDSEEALSDPFHPDVEGLSNQPFLELPFLEYTLSDTHFEDRNRQGRLLVMLARAGVWSDQPVRTIACNDATAVGISPDGVARVFGEYPDFPDFAWFVSNACTESEFGPEIMEAGEPITWNNNGQALSVYRLQGDVEGSYSFDLSEWSPNGGGFWQYWSADAGNLQFTHPGDSPNSCSPSSITAADLDAVRIYPNPVSELLYLETSTPLGSISLFDAMGREVLREEFFSGASGSFLNRTSAGGNISDALENQARFNWLDNQDPNNGISTCTLDVYDIPTGLYTLRLQDLHGLGYLSHKISVVRKF